MNRLSTILLVLLAIGLGCIVYLVILASHGQSDALPSEVDADSIRSYELQADSLERVAEYLESKLARAGLLQRPAIRLQFEQLKREISGFRVAIERWRSARDKYGKGQAYKHCLLLYGRASGVCDALGLDTLPESTDR